MIQSILIIFLFGCFGTVTNAELCTDCAKFILETEYKPKDWPVLEPRPKVVGGPRTVTGVAIYPNPGGRLQQWDIEHGGFQYKISIDEKEDQIPFKHFLGLLASLPSSYRRALKFISEEGNGLEFLKDGGGR